MADSSQPDWSNVIKIHHLYYVPNNKINKFPLLLLLKELIERTFQYIAQGTLLVKIRIMTFESTILSKNVCRKENIKINKITEYK